jgi:nicotinamidase-related amidase
MSNMISPCIFIDMDTQRDFFEPAGAMPIKGAQEIRPNLKKLTNTAVKKKITIISGVENHNGETLKKGPFYCMEGTPGQKKISETTVKNSRTVAQKKEKVNHANLLKKYRQIVLEKNGFDLFTNANAMDFLKKSGTKNCVVYGVAIDLGLEKLVLKLLETGFKVWIPVDAVKPINEDNREPVMKELRSKGAEMWNTEFIINNV